MTNATTTTEIAYEGTINGVPNIAPYTVYRTHGANNRTVAGVFETRAAAETFAAAQQRPTTNIVIAHKTYSIEGISDERLTCDHCGKANLKRTVVLRHTDSGSVEYFGTTCAAKAAGWQTAQVRRAATAAVDARKAARLDAIHNHPLYIASREEVAQANRDRVPFSQRPTLRWSSMQAKAIDEIDGRDVPDSAYAFLRTA